MIELDNELFPSPTGVNYYEYNDEDFFNAFFQNDPSFRPQQGLTIMNDSRSG